MDELVAFDESIQALGDRYSWYRQKVEKMLSSGDDQDYLTARQMLTDILSTETAQDVFPGFSETLENLDTAIMKSVQQAEEEPLVNLPLEKNLLIMIKRIADTGEEITIGRGIIIGFSDKKIEASVDNIFEEGMLPTAMDMIYMEVKTQ